MRWLRGGSLQNVLQKGAYDLPAALLLLDHIAAALSLAHRSQVIHRDIKPSNILLDEDGNAYLTDFGIAKDLNGAGNNTQPDAIVGSLDYISPEQARSEAVTHRTDIYSLGVRVSVPLTRHIIRFGIPLPASTATDLRNPDKAQLRADILAMLQ